MSGFGKARWHWWSERITSVALIPLSVWFIGSLASQDLANRVHFEQWVGQTDTLVWLSLFFLTSLYHAKLGVEVIVDDYINDPAWNRSIRRVTRLVLFLSLVAALSGLLHFLT